MNDYIPARNTDPDTSHEAALIDRSGQFDELANIFEDDYWVNGVRGLTNWDVQQIGGYKEIGDFSSRIKQLRDACIIVKNGKRKPAPDRAKQTSHVWVPPDERDGIRRTELIADVEEL